MPAATVTSKGQITIPSAVRKALGVDTGDRINFIQTADGAFTIVAATLSVTALKGLLKKPARVVTIEEMNETIASKGGSAQ
ncbi:AbrB/MazE/SpoVT family DNA-binding domain-containing protein [Candidatus Phyllobacterium onerii]|uniref:AbrB/MazE/SpoVT family DNA-binding domain-containing protein n=1 Tax=Candidatus Phyllobacterium onerii TaxID=3020828 RepID=UPI00232F43C5|nr:type II toxin-antitoxin system PrlF family antitoxin [Phyllobacterium sp. IY22]